MKLSAAQAAAGATVGLVVLAVGQIALSRRQARRDEVHLLAQLLERWSGLKTDWERLILIARGPSSYYLMTPVEDTARYRSLIAARRDEAARPGEYSRWLALNHELHSYRRAAESCLAFFSTTCLLTLSGRLSADLLYGVFGTELIRSGGAIRALIEYPDSRPAALGYDLLDLSGSGDTPDQAELRAEETMRFIVREWVSYQPGTGDRVLALLDLLWAEAAKRRDLSARDLALAATIKQRLKTGARNRRRVRRLAALGGHRWQGHKLSQSLRYAERRRWFRPEGVQMPRALREEVDGSVFTDDELEALRQRYRADD